MTVLLADPQITGIPALDNGEALVDVTALGLAYSGTDDTGRRVRAALASRLVVAESLLPRGIHLLIRQGHRSPTEQQSIIAAYSAELRRDRPELDDLAVRRLSSRFVSPIEIAPHVAGAAVDLTLADASGTKLWMGTPIDATPEESANACEFAATNISAEARANRDLLASVLTPQGLINYPTEWWHWSYGDRYWAYATGADSAIYEAAA
jgi:D-alanyl-D-alanine dipeptidase